MLLDVSKGSILLDDCDMEQNQFLGNCSCSIVGTTTKNDIDMSNPAKF